MPRASLGAGDTSPRVPTIVSSSPFSPAGSCCAACFRQKANRFAAGGSDFFCFEDSPVVPAPQKLFFLGSALPFASPVFPAPQKLFFFGPAFTFASLVFSFGPAFTFASLVFPAPQKPFFFGSVSAVPFGADAGTVLEGGGARGAGFWGESGAGGGAGGLACSLPRRAGFVGGEPVGDSVGTGGAGPGAGGGGVCVAGAEGREEDGRAVERAGCDGPGLVAVPEDPRESAGFCGACGHSLDGAAWLA